MSKFTQPKKVLSFGCGNIDEVRELLHHFPIEKLVCVDIDESVVATLQAYYKDMPQVDVVHTSVFFSQQTLPTFDLVVCCNVLRSVGGGVPLPFDSFKIAVEELWDLTTGNLLVTGANWRACDVLLCEKIEVWGNSGQTPCYKMEAGNNNPVLLPRTDAKVIMCNKKKTPPPPPPQPTSEEKDIHRLFHNPGTLSGKRRINVGILSVAHGTNVGDFSQCLAAVNAWSRFYRPSWHIEAPELREALEFFSRSKPLGPQVRARNYDAEVFMYFIDRDTTHNVPSPAGKDGGPIYVIANGWYMTTGGGATYQLPLAPWIHPFLVSMHLHKPDALQQPGVVEWMNRFGPVGCRDTDTEQLFRSYGVDCYYSQCLTTTMEMPFSDLTDKSPHDTFRVDQNKRFTQEGDQVFSHLMPDFMTPATPGQVMQKMLGLLRQYVESNHLASTRIHAVMPAKAMGAQSVQFCSPVHSNCNSWNVRSRFSGLLEGFETPAKREILALFMFERLTQVLDNLFVSGFYPEQLQRAWKGQFIQEPLFMPHGEMLDVATVSDGDLPFSWSAARKTHPAIVRTRVGGLVETFATHPAMHALQRQSDPYNSKISNYRLRTVPVKAFLHNIDIIICFDDNYIPYCKEWMVGLSRHHPTELCRVFCVTRDVSPKNFQELLVHAAHFPNVVLFQIHSTEEFDSFHTSLSHTNKCVLDRLFLTVQPYNVDDVVERVLYLDLDITIAGNISDLTRRCTGQMGLLAKSSKQKGVVKKWLKNGKSKVKYASDKGFNAGVLAVDLSKLRHNNFWKCICDLFFATGGMNDQILLTVYSQGRYAELPSKFNIFVSQDDDDFTYVQNVPNSGAIFHHAGSVKPYQLTLEDYCSKNKGTRKYDRRHWVQWQSMVEKIASLEDHTSHYVYA
jgi:lipopolysaccharide biosynthesis glycosyltransferase